MDKYLGKRLDGRYEIHELIGVGGMANVYRCTDTVDDREVAVKILKDEYLNNEEFIRRFKNESKAIAMLSHPNIVKVYDVSFGDMIQYIVMEYIDGITLKEYIDQQGIIEWKDAIHLTAQILKALQHAHECGIVHRDIKPQNIMLLQDGTIKVTDFGIARFSDKSTRTMTEQAIGSVHYIAPEQALLEELLFNLCSNAVRYNKKGGSVTIVTTIENTRPVLIVKDTGIGIPKEQQERVFERFYRVDKSRSKSTGGTGLGLAIVKHIVAQHDAQMTLTSEVGVGTEIKIVF